MCVSVSGGAIVIRHHPRPFLFPPPDRTNLAFAAAGLRADVGLTLSQYGLGSSLLFVTYCGAQLPVAIVGARCGLTRTLAAA